MLKTNFKWLNAYFFYELEPESEPDHSSATLVWTWISYPTHGLHVLRNTPFRKEITPGQALLIEYELFYSFLNKVTTSINSNSTHQRVTHVLCTQVLPITVYTGSSTLCPHVHLIQTVLALIQGQTRNTTRGTEAATYTFCWRINGYSLLKLGLSRKKY